MVPGEIDEKKSLQLTINVDYIATRLLRHLPVSDGLCHPSLVKYVAPIAPKQSLISENEQSPPSASHLAAIFPLKLLKTICIGKRCPAIAQHSDANILKMNLP